MVLPVVYYYFLIIFYLSQFAMGTDWCAISSCGKGHTMCLYPNSGGSSKCEKYEAAPLSSSEKTALVNRHNEFRKKVAAGSEKRGSPGPQPAATDMNMLDWDDELATVAQRWADQCINGHDSCRNVDRFTVGQNIATYWSTGSVDRNIEGLVDDWYNEVKDFKKNYVHHYKAGLGWGHYSQLVWAKTKYLGCGRVRFWDSSRRMNTLRLVCNYGPAGNYRDQPVYTASTNQNHRTINKFVVVIVLLSHLKIFQHF